MPASSLPETPFRLAEVPVGVRLRSMGWVTVRTLPVHKLETLAIRPDAGLGHRRDVRRLPGS